MPSKATYVNPGSIIAIAVIFPVLTVLVVAGRIQSRRLKGIRLGYDDYCCFAAAIILIGCSVDLIVGAAIHTVGSHSTPSSTNFAIPHITQLTRVEWAYNQMWYTSITLVKLSWLLFYQKLFRGRIFSLINYTVMALVLAWGVTFFLLNLFQCGRFVGDNWIPLPQFFNPRCVNSLAVFFANALISCFLDTVIFILPMPLVWSLNMSRKNRIALMGVFAIGAFCVAASAMRLALYGSLWWAVRTHNEKMSILGLRGADDFGIVSLALFWSQIELGVALIACCLPSVKKAIVETSLFQSLHSLHSSISLHSTRRRLGSRQTSTKDSFSEEVPPEMPSHQLLQSSLAKTPEKGEKSFA